MRLRVMRPSRTPAWWTSCRRCSTPGAPLGIFLKSSAPSVFWPIHRKGAWSDEITDSTSRRRASQSASQSDGRRGGGVNTNFAPSKSGRARSARSVKRYWVHVSAQTACPTARARATGSRASAQLTCTT
jgi:hypothetical protein